MQRQTTIEEWRPKCEAPRLGFEQHKKYVAPRLGFEQKQQVTYYCSYLGHQNEVTFVGRISERPKSEPFAFIRLFLIRGPCLFGKDGRMKEGGY